MNSLHLKATIQYSAPFSPCEIPGKENAFSANEQDEFEAEDNSLPKSMMSRILSDMGGHHMS